LLTAVLSARVRNLGGTGVVYDTRMLGHRNPTGKHPEQVWTGLGTKERF